jgi:hypothetical protein
VTKSELIAAIADVPDDAVVGIIYDSTQEARAGTVFDAETRWQCSKCLTIYSNPEWCGWCEDFENRIPMIQISVVFISTF